MPSSDFNLQSVTCREDSLKFWEMFTPVQGCGLGSFGRILIFSSDMGVWSDPGVLDGSRYFGRIRVFLPDPDVLFGSGCFGRIRVFLPDPDVLFGFGFWSDLGVMVGSGCFGRIRVF